jgi:hypothetical protein
MCMDMLFLFIYTLSAYITGYRALNRKMIVTDTLGRTWK